MTQNATSEARHRSPLGRWMVVGAIAAVPATWGIASVASGDSSPLANPAPRVASEAAPAIVQAEVTSGPASFVGITPLRVLDTRPATAVGTPGAMGPNTQRDVQVAGIPGIPAEATSVAVNVTIDQDATLKSFITVWPAGETRPLASTNNAEPGLVSPNSALIKVGQGGNISVFNQQGTVNVVIDVTGYFIADAGGGTTTTTTTPGSTTTTSTTTTTTMAPQAPPG